ncbi:hypothetical protein [Bogoriella caseilytica]|uniref:Fis family transcriptional regulator n=1 Tax=Bogoriella caseilytica TaxID=56055 RepID=A0A3N2BER1_9MICO|nr:hypothetical protein [Bogoriella caseilytica]ROR73751.1 hypothetical protein EDD31_2139 [Bogoriella caseilytica]
MGEHAQEWESLIEELSAGLEAAERAEHAVVAAELLEAETASTELADRLRARRGDQLRLRLRSGDDVAGIVLDAGPHWVLLGAGRRRSLVPITAIQMAQPLGAVAPPPGEVDRRLGLARVVRAIAREGATVSVACEAGSYSGRIVRVGRDHLDLRTEAGVLTVAFGALAVVSSL